MASTANGAARLATGLVPLLLLLQALRGGAAAPVTPQIVGGYDSPAGRFPYVTLLLVWQPATSGEDGEDAQPATPVWRCTGSLIREDVVLTAAHCVNGIPAGGFFTAYAGSNTNPLAAGSTPLVLGPSWAFAINTGYFDGVTPGDEPPATHPNDLALVFFNECITPGASMGIVKVATLQELAAAVKAGNTFVAAGWGKNSTQYVDTSVQGLPPVLQYALMKPMSNKDCSTVQTIGSAPPAVQLADSQMCAYGLPRAPGQPDYPPNQGTCPGDSGGPLALSVDKAGAQDPTASSPTNDRVVGITSYGAGCGENKMPPGFTKASSFISWISTQLASRPKRCAGAPPPPAPTCVKESPSRNWYAQPTTTVRVDRKTAYDQCCTECKARAQQGNGNSNTTSGCVAFSVNYYTSAGHRRLHGATPPRPKASGSFSTGVATTCTTCDADCDIYENGVPPRVCKPSDKPVAASGIYCAVKSLGSARISFG